MKSLTRDGPCKLRHGSELYLTESFYRVVLQKSIPAQIRQLILCISDGQVWFHGFVRELTFAKQLYKHFV
jgi:hypothetical protein